MRRARSQLGHLRLLLPLLLLSQAASSAFSAERPRLVVRDAGACGEVAGRYVALLEEHRGLVVSAGAFPDGSPIGTARGGKLAGELRGYGRVELSVEPEDEVYGIAFEPAASPAPVGCVAFDKDRFTWASDLLTYVRYLADELLAAAQKIDPSRASLEVRDRKVRIEVSRPGQAKRTLARPREGL